MPVKKIKNRIKARFRKGKKDLKQNISNFFEWVKGAELVELKECDFEKDPVRPELNNEFRTSFGRKIYGVKIYDFSGKHVQSVKGNKSSTMTISLEDLYEGI